jgi:hypothetical protein
MAVKHYTHMEAAILAHYRNVGGAVTVEPPGRGHPDIEGVDKTGGKIIGEIKSARECSGSPSAWWSYWNQGARQLAAAYPDKAESISATAKGWCAVVDGQLREYCRVADVARADLVVESFARFASDVKLALSFLSKCGRVRVVGTDIDAHGIGYVEIVFS